MNLSNREELWLLCKASQPDPQATQMSQAAQQAQIQFQQFQIALLVSQAAESQARATKLAAEAQAVPEELEIDRINAITRNLRKETQKTKSLNAA